jgi:hypothetical protein
MTIKKPTIVKTNSTQKPSTQLIVEAHPVEYTGFPFVTLIQYRKQPMLAIIDNIDGEYVKAFVLDMCGPEEVNEEAVIHAAAQWYENSRVSYPISIEFSRRGMTSATSKIYRDLNIEYISRIIGPTFKYSMVGTGTVKRRRRKPIASNIEISTNVINAENLFI